VKDAVFFKQAELVLRVLPMIREEAVFALKGGTAINLFVRDLPRLSVDIDLAYLPVNERETALEDIDRALRRISELIRRRLPGTQIVGRQAERHGRLTAITIRREQATIKVEPNLVLRGSVYGTEIRPLSKRAQELFELSMDARTLSTADLYGGKICAALDRQHPRDLFDVRLLLQTEGLTEKTRRAFIVYLISHGRPMYEILRPGLVDIRPSFEKDFQGMVAEEISCDDLRETRDRLVERASAELTLEERQFIVSVKEGQPRWDLFDIPGIADLPAVKWKLINISRMDPAKHKDALRRLRDYLGV
jgi:predicted nucleotidyltransferase component of viral defense system